MELERYRTSAEAFMSQLTGEYYRHYAGLKDSYEIESIYQRHRDLFTCEAVQSLQEMRISASRDSEDRRALTMLVDFAVEGYIGEATKALASELARREAELSIAVDGEQLGFRRSSVVQANESDAVRRAAIEHARMQAIAEHLNGLYRDQLALQHACARGLGWSSYREMCEDCKQLDLDVLHAQTGAFLERTAEPYPGVLEPELRRSLAIGFSELRRSDLPRFFRAADQDPLFPAERLLPAFVETMQGLGIEVEAQPGVALDVEPRPNKSPRAFCAPVRSPGEVYLVLIGQPFGCRGLDRVVRLAAAGRGPSVLASWKARMRPAPPGGASCRKRQQDVARARARL